MVGNPDVNQALRVRDGDPTDVPNALRPRHQPSIGTRRLRIVGAEYPLLAKPLQCPRTVEEAGGATLPFHGAFEKFSLQRPDSPSATAGPRYILARAHSYLIFHGATRAFRALPWDTF